MLPALLLLNSTCCVVPYIPAATLVDTVGFTLSICILTLFISSWFPNSSTLKNLISVVSVTLNGALYFSELKVGLLPSTL